MVSSHDKHEQGSDMPTLSDPKRSPQVLMAPRRESQQQSKAAPRRAGPYEVGFAGYRSRDSRGRVRPDTAAELSDLDYPPPSQA